MSETKSDSKTPATVEDNSPEYNSALETEHGRTHIDDVVVAKIAGMAAREVSGVHALGGGAARALGALRDMAGSRVDVRQGVSVEVGETQAAADVAIVAEYGVAIHELADAIRRNIINAIERMTGLEVTEVNVTVHDVHLDLDDDKSDDDEETKELEAPEAQTDHAPRVK
ncbi:MULTISPECIES: Asp23/Gls24 family envelope stress response protein [unclassified Corynebacterium]|uniref:Asp23/Gls24 family envelope stress response protein n=1 Tax=unclassified Corynebacterium TaxID=2624378 RepID=UPI0035235CCC